MPRHEVLALRDYLDPGLTGRTITDARHSASLREWLQNEPKLGA